jgi:hypothetical protein
VDHFRDGQALNPNVLDGVEILASAFLLTIEPQKSDLASWDDSVRSYAVALRGKR